MIELCSVSIQNQLCALLYSIMFSLFSVLLQVTGEIIRVFQVSFLLLLMSLYSLPTIQITSEMHFFSFAVNPCCHYPCQNAGVCVRFSTDQYQCDCTGTGFYGDNCIVRKDINYEVTDGSDEHTQHFENHTCL